MCDIVGFVIDIFTNGGINHKNYEVLCNQNFLLCWYHNITFLGVKHIRFLKNVLWIKHLNLIEILLLRFACSVTYIIISFQMIIYWEAKNITQLCKVEQTLFLHHVWESGLQDYTYTTTHNYQRESNGWDCLSGDCIISNTIFENNWIHRNVNT